LGKFFNFAEPTRKVKIFALMKFCQEFIGLITEKNFFFQRQRDSNFFKKLISPQKINLSRKFFCFKILNIELILELSQFFAFSAKIILIKLTFLFDSLKNIVKEKKIC